MNKSNLTLLVCYESKMVNVNINDLWIDFDSTIYITNSLQDMQNVRKPVGSERNILFGNKMDLHVEVIGTCELILSSGFVLELDMTFYVPRISRNLISMSKLVPFKCSFNFSKRC